MNLAVISLTWLFRLFAGQRGLFSAVGVVHPEKGSPGSNLPEVSPGTTAQENKHASVALFYDTRALHYRGEPSFRVALL